MILSRFIIKYEHQNNVAYDAFIEIKMEFTFKSVTSQENKFYPAYFFFSFLYYSISCCKKKEKSRRRDYKSKSEMMYSHYTTI